ncbi:MAG: DUF1127 domain-containing protein [Hoeflea sp.]|uniref:DUF1127 domain-containing protein n=1 Tax=Hoeflea sp. TaxID=1940281 RepID=UPI001D872275|nr:DUF1127 domain-containing protein [Hoeflea sp.]MBU4530390.1 DUF1127 domain-containing protein [Alphaproteobacteria bacterium]MBU4545177.1 DUF1127 domain-containing protein [Alphaproteobacteria bacterium]MBU4549623.1 DUF1127 domain-containing protein [Alphaproteobacteria bacterium]MBV1721980.1 DUF1127 domain-containing protein [Hoeflea sp.]MBV1761330.1 DUF1127 domain-containing protein [Hoeflea sp.]
MQTIVPHSRAELPVLERNPVAHTHRHRQAKPRTLRHYLGWILHGFEVQRTRRALQRLTDEELRDIGLRPDEAAREAKRPIWDRISHVNRWG